MVKRSVLLALVCVLLASSVYGAVTIVRGSATTTATLVYTAPGRGSEVLFMNIGAADIYFGPAGVTTANGFKAKADVQLQIKLMPRETLYVIVAAATEPYQILEVPQR